VHIWEVKATYMNFIDCTHNLTNFKMCTSQHGCDGEETMQPDSLETICPHEMVDKTLCSDLEQIAYIYACLSGNKCFLGLRVASNILELRVVKQFIARLISA